MLSSTTKRIILVSVALSIPVLGHVILDVNDDPTNFETIIHQSVETIGNEQSFYIKSNVPVSVLQYKENVEPDRLIPQDKAVVLLKSTCTSDEAFKSFNPSSVVEKFFLFNTNQPLLYVNVDLGDATVKGTVSPSSFVAEWDTVDEICDFEQNQVEEDDEETTLLEELSQILMAAAATTEKMIVTGDDTLELTLVEPASTTTTSTEPTTTSTEPTTSEGCSISAEIIYDACATSLMVDAPSVDVYRGAQVEDYKSKPDDLNKCKIVNSGVLTYPPFSANSFVDEDFIMVEQYAEIQCHQTVIGRPFIDVNGDLIQAEANIVEKSEWNLSNQDKKLDAQDKSKYQAEGTDWTNRALGEHSSIASFAIFTIDLMTNNAPPDLIADALQAAMDEYRHARTSFDMASLLTQQNISPGPLPPTSHSFEQDLRGLAFRAAQEGCVDETISAMLAAAEVMKLTQQEDIITMPMPGQWKEKVEIIAREEARHSSLAWRTVDWVCSKDQIICDEVIQHLRDQAHGRFEKQYADIKEATAAGLDGACAPFPEGLDILGFCKGINGGDLQRFREAEITHGRVSMIATVGFLVGEQVEGSSFLFDAQVTGPAIDHFQQTPGLVWGLVGATIFLLESTRVQKGWSDPFTSELFSLNDDYVPGQWGFDPLGLSNNKTAEDMAEARLKEINNGRLAMISISGMVAQELVNGLNLIPADEVLEEGRGAALVQMGKQCAGAVDEAACAKAFEAAERVAVAAGK